MDVYFEKVLILFVIVAFIATSINLFISVETPITREQAIEISKKSQLVQQGIQTSSSFGIEANYYDSSRIEELKRLREQSPAYEWLGAVTNDEFWEFKVPEGHSVWEIIWWFNNPGFLGGYDAIVIIDAERLIIIAEPEGIRWG